jgi:hypothetical protein
MFLYGIYDTDNRAILYTKKPTEDRPESYGNFRLKTFLDDRFLSAISEHDRIPASSLTGSTVYRILPVLKFFQGPVVILELSAQKCQNVISKRFCLVDQSLFAYR